MYIKYVPYNNNIKYYINCATENGTIGYPIQYCPICGKNLNKS